MLNRLGAVLIVGLGALALRVNGETAGCASALEAGKFRRGEAKSAEIKRCEEEPTAAPTAVPTAMCSNDPNPCNYYWSEENYNWPRANGHAFLSHARSFGHYCIGDYIQAGIGDYHSGFYCRFTNEESCDDDNFLYCADNVYLPEDLL